MKEENQGQNADSPKKEEKKTVSRKKTSKGSNEVKKLKEENALLKDQLLRKVAEFDNYKKRTERDFYDRVQNANERLIGSLLPVLDDFERSLAHASDANNTESLLEGVELVYKKMYSLLEKEGLKPLDAIGHDFDPDKHDALMQVESKDHDSGTIVDEHLKGYQLNDKVLRHSQVIVAK